jgi:hydroxyacylglutathione hydrolase
VLSCTLAAISALCTGYRFVSDYIKQKIGKDDQFLFIIPAFEDNYIYLLSSNGKAVVIDPGDGPKVAKILKDEHLQLEGILISHHHFDHTGGNPFLFDKTESSVIGPDDIRIPRLSQTVCQGDALTVASFYFEVLSTPGHTCPHLAYILPSFGFLFSGDLLFGGGCGRLFEGTADEMWESLKKIRCLPDETQIFFGHEYTLQNLTFALEIEPYNQDVRKRFEEVKNTCKRGAFTVPSTIGLEKKTNPFLRADDPVMKKRLGKEKERDVSIFSFLRKMKDQG